MIRQAGQFQSGIGQNIHRIGDDQYDTVPVLLHNSGNDLPEHIDIALQQIHPGFARSLTCSGRDNYDIGVRAVLICPFPDADPGYKGNPMI